MGVSNSEMSNFFDEQGRTRVYAEAYMTYAASENPRRTLIIGKRAISGWKLKKPPKEPGWLAPIT